jgi:hypothetical protein
VKSEESLMISMLENRDHAADVLVSPQEGDQHAAHTT